MGVTISPRSTAAGAVPTIAAVAGCEVSNTSGRALVPGSHRSRYVFIREGEVSSLTDKETVEGQWRETIGLSPDFQCRFWCSRSLAATWDSILLKVVPP